jgi:putative transposase
MPLHSKSDPQNTPAEHLHHRQSIRIKEYDYTLPGAYFVTIVTCQRVCLLGDIQSGAMVLNAFGQIAAECWRSIPEHFSSVELGAYVIMPNHMHGIIHIINDDGRGAIYRAPTENVEQFGKPIKGSLPSIIRTYKAAVTRLIGREHNAAGIWQRNYYEHIIRDEKDLQRITDYINANPLRWNDDDENPVRAKT